MFSLSQIVAPPATCRAAWHATKTSRHGLLLPAAHLLSNSGTVTSAGRMLKVTLPVWVVGEGSLNVCANAEEEHAAAMAVALQTSGQAAQSS